jgi:hypothetical protein
LGRGSEVELLIGDFDEELLKILNGKILFMKILTYQKIPIAFSKTSSSQ